MNEGKVKKAAVYPYNPEFTAVVRYLEKLNPMFQIVRLVVPYGFRCDGKDAGILYNKPEMGITVTENIEEALNTCDCLIVADGSYSDRFSKIIIKNIESAIEKGKEVICTWILNEEELASLKEKSQYNGVPFLYCPEHLDIEKYIPNMAKKLYSPQVPVIFVGEAISGLDAFEITLGITYYLRQEGYKVLTLTEKPWCGLLNTASIPDFMLKYEKDDNHKIYAFNQLLKQLEQKENPDVILIQLPGAIMKYNDRLTAGFGIMPYFISLAVQGDYMVFCSQFERMDLASYKMLSEGFEHRIGVGIDILHISNITIDATSMGSGKFSFIRVEQNRVDEEISRLNKTSEIPVYNCCNPKECEKMSMQLIGLLKTGSVA